MGEEVSRFPEQAEGVGGENKSEEKVYGSETFEKSINQVTLLGRVGSDPQVRGSETKQVTIFSLATNTRWKTGEEWSYRTDWHNIAVFQPNLKEKTYTYITKGSRVYVTGKLLYGEITDRNGVKRTTTSIAADDIISFR